MKKESIQNIMAKLLKLRSLSRLRERVRVRDSGYLNPHPTLSRKRERERRRQYSSVSLAVIVFIVFAAPALAEKPDPASIPALKVTIAQGMKPIWLGSSNGLNGWLITDGQDTTLIYTTADGKAFIPGVLYDENGKSITGTQMDALEKAGILKPAAASKPQEQGISKSSAALLTALEKIKEEQAAAKQPPAPTIAQATTPLTEQPIDSQIFKELEKASWFKIGNDGLPYAYMFFDPMCPYCKLLYVDLARQALTKGKMQLRMVPVAILMKESAQHSSALLDSSNPVKLWNGLVFDEKEAKDAVGNDLSMSKAEANTEILHKWGLKGVPATVYRGKDGKVMVLNGRPESVEPLIANIRG